MSQKVYILTNPAIPNLIKIGKTLWPLEGRVAELSRASGVPLPFEVFYAAEVMDMDKCEKLLHETFMDRRINPRREFFSVAPEQAVSALKLAEIVNITPHQDIVDSPEEQRALDEGRKKREKINLSMIDVPTGALLKFVDDEFITCIVLEHGKVMYEWMESSLSAAAVKAYAKLGRNITYPLQGPLYRVYDGETLNERRMRIELGE